MTQRNISLASVTHSGPLAQLPASQYCTHQASISLPLTSMSCKTPPDSNLPLPALVLPPTLMPRDSVFKLKHWQAFPILPFQLFSPSPDQFHPSSVLPVPLQSLQNAEVCLYSPEEEYPQGYLHWRLADFQCHTSGRRLN